jgi:hypothetical protein
MVTASDRRVFGAVDADEGIVATPSARGGTDERDVACAINHDQIAIQNRAPRSWRLHSLTVATELGWFSRSCVNVASACDYMRVEPAVLA